jgi:hypothetical protein
VRCPVNIPNVADGNKIVLTFTGLDFDDQSIVIPGSEYTSSDTLTSADISNGYYEFTVPVAILRKLCLGYGRASYTLENDKGIGSSNSTDVIIDLSDATDPMCAIVPWP